MNPEPSEVGSIDSPPSTPNPVESPTKEGPVNEPMSVDAALVASGARRKARKQVAAKTGQRVVAVSLLLVCTLWLLVLLHVDKIFSSSTPTGGDNAVHIWTSDYLKRVLLPQGRLWGWSNDSFAGLPVLSSYFPLPTWLIVAMSFVMPLGVAYKIMTVIGLVTLPSATYRLGKKASLAWPEPLLLAVGTFPFLLARHFKILGGNIMSTMAGEFSFSISLSLTVLYMGGLVHLLRTGRGRTRTTLTLAAVGLCHVVPAILAIGFTVACVLCELRRRSFVRQVTDALIVGLSALALGAFWIIPFGANLRYSNSMDYERNTRWFRTLIPLLPKSSTLHTPADGVSLASIAFVCTLIAIAVGLKRKDRFIATMTLTAIFNGAAFALAPRGAMWNNRLLPAWFFCIYVLGATGLYHAARIAHHRWTRRKVSRKVSRNSSPNSSDIATIAPKSPGVLFPSLLAALIACGTMLNGTVSKAAHLPFAWANGNYTGTEGRSKYPEYRAIVDVLQALPCGRLWAEPSKKYESYGSTLSMTALPYWTKSCVQMIDGLYFEASQTTPFSYVTSRSTVKAASQGQRRLPYLEPDFPKGIERLERLGVRYTLLSSKESIATANTLATLRFVVATGPYRIYEIRNNAIVVPLTVEPVVMEGLEKNFTDFTDAGLAQWVRPTEFPPLIAEHGPASWLRAAIVRKSPATPPVGTKAPAVRRGDGMSMATSARSVEPPVVSNVVIGQHSVRFGVDQIGKPVLVRVSWYPNWKVRGAKGPYRVAPNFMVVIPTKNSVTLDYRYTRIEALAVAVSALGLIALFFAWRSSRRRTYDWAMAESELARSAPDSVGPPQVDLRALAATPATVEPSHEANEESDEKSAFEPDAFQQS